MPQKHICKDEFHLTIFWHFCGCVKFLSQFSYFFLVGPVYLHSTPLECKRRTASFSIDISRLWREDAFICKNNFLLQRSNMSIEINIVRRCTPAECYVCWRGAVGVNRLYKGTLPKYLHTPFAFYLILSVLRVIMTRLAIQRLLYILEV